MAGITGLASDLIGVISKSGISAVGFMLDGLTPQARQALAWVILSRVVGALRAAGPDGAPMIAGSLEALGLPKAAAIEIAGELLKQVDAELETSRPN